MGCINSHFWPPRNPKRTLQPQKERRSASPPALDVGQLFKNGKIQEWKVATRRGEGRLRMRVGQAYMHVARIIFDGEHAYYKAWWRQDFVRRGSWRYRWCDAQPALERRFLTPAQF